MDHRKVLRGLIKTLNKARSKSKNQRVSMLLDEALDLSVREYGGGFSAKDKVGPLPPYLEEK